MSTSAAKEFPPEKIRSIAAEVASLLKERKESVCVAETVCFWPLLHSLYPKAEKASMDLLTLGLAGCTPGASGIYKGGLTLYTLESRIAFAGWTQETITSYRGPTTDIVAGLATNVRPKLGATYCVSESGTAGPTGGDTPNRTPGYVALAVATESGTYTKELSTGHGGDREANMIQFAVEGLGLLRDVIKGDAKL
ncbi:CinA-like protein [Lachnellula willkommii]|uniref:CinA-like protein n=1 Tax=Lachnellula willkommii TaxID=215461 RepID=A0A559M2S3_9HELO|nr:CinA-like protein [Lachnellula willkommii]